MSTSADFPFASRGFARIGLATGAMIAGGLVTGAALAQGQSANPCAIYGAGFVSVHGGDTCVRIGGRVRVEGAIVPRQDVYSAGQTLNFAPVGGALDGPDRAHVRVPQNGMPRTR